MLQEQQKEPGHYPNPLGRSNPAGSGHEDLSGRLGGSPEYSVSVIDYNQPAARAKQTALASSVAAAAVSTSRSSLMSGDASSMAASVRMTMQPGLVSDEDDDEQFDVQAALDDLEEYVETHPDFITAVIFWVITGNILILLGVIIILYSEIKMVCVVRSQEARRALLETQGSTTEVDEIEAKSVASRPYLTFLATVLFFFGIFLSLIPLCDVLHLLGLPTGVTCIYIISMEALVFALILSFLLIGLCWSCTRPWAGVVLIVLALCGLVLCPTANVLLLILFLFLAFSVYMVYFVWYPDYLKEQHQARPDWLQSIGSLQVTLEHTHWLEAGTVITSTAWQEAAGAISGKTEEDSKDKAS